MGERRHQLESTSMLAEAARSLRDALALLDEAKAPSDIGALIDLALSRLDGLDELGVKVG